MRREHNFEEKLNIVSQIKNGHPLNHLCRICELDPKMVREWVYKYNLYGEIGLHKQPRVKVSPEFKEEVVRQVMDKFISLPQVALVHGVSQGTLKSWVRAVKAKGYSILYQQEKRGQPAKAMGRPKKHIPITELEKLQAENARLKAENALLKKVKALVEEREARERQIGQRPSKN